MAEHAEREPGFYWIRHPEWGWLIGEWQVQAWRLCGRVRFLDDRDFAEIGERVEQEPEQPEWLREAIRRNWQNINNLQPRGGATNVQRALAWPEPQPITDAQKTGERFLVWVSGSGWCVAWHAYHGIKGGAHPGDHWRCGICDDPGDWVEIYTEVTHWLPLPPDVKP